MTVKKSKTFQEFVDEDGMIEIEYSYGDSKNGLCTICWRVSEERTENYTTRYNGSSPFAMWWCGISDALEEFQDAEKECEDEEDGDEWFDRKYPDASCHRCEKKVVGATVVYCGGGGGACEMWYCSDCHEEVTHDCMVCNDGQDDSTIIVSGIVCKKCENELPPMTMKQHLNGDFNKECPHP